MHLNSNQEQLSRSEIISLQLPWTLGASCHVDELCLYVICGIYIISHDWIIWKLIRQRTSPRCIEQYIGSTVSVKCKGSGGKT